jgi:LDH2 family malate/lactate/ureidoglycolate dehydrogenase
LNKSGTGDPEFEQEQKRAKEGIPLVAAVIQDLRRLGKDCGIHFD